MTTHGQKRYPYFGVPPARQPRPAGDVPSLRGKRVILSTPDGFVYDMRAVSEAKAEGDVVEIVTEEAYYRWMFTTDRPEAVSYSAELVWAE